MGTEATAARASRLCFASAAPGRADFPPTHKTDGLFIAD